MLRLIFDIAFVDGIMEKHSSSLRLLHYNAIQHIMKYLKCIIHFKLYFYTTNMQNIYMLMLIMLQISMIKNKKMKVLFSLMVTQSTIVLLIPSMKQNIQLLHLFKGNNLS
jgi:hypothetical protein